MEWEEKVWMESMDFNFFLELFIFSFFEMLIFKVQLPMQFSKLNFNPTRKILNIRKKNQKKNQKYD